MAQITDFIKQAMASGYNENQIEYMLTKKGWDRITVNQAILDVKFHTEKEAYLPQHSYTFFHNLPKRKILLEICIILVIFAFIGAIIFPNIASNVRPEKIAEASLPNPDDSTNYNESNINSEGISINIVDSAAGANSGKPGSPSLALGWCVPDASWSYNSLVMQVCGLVSIGERNICHASQACPVGGYFFTENNNEIWQLLPDGAEVKIK